MDASSVFGVPIASIVVAVVVVVGAAALYVRSKQHPIGLDPENWQPFTRKFAFFNTLSWLTLLLQLLRLKRRAMMFDA